LPFLAALPPKFPRGINDDDSSPLKPLQPQRNEEKNSTKICVSRTWLAYVPHPANHTISLILYMRLYIDALYLQIHSVSTFKCKVYYSNVAHVFMSVCVCCCPLSCVAMPTGPSATKNSIKKTKFTPKFDCTFIRVLMVPVVNQLSTR